MSKPRLGDWTLLKRIGRYLRYAPRLIQEFNWQAMPRCVDVHVDSDWAGCATTCKSTSGGAISLGCHAAKAWSITQATIALSSGEAELYALVKGAGQALGMVALMEDLGYSLDARVHSDSSAAIGISNRKGLGKLRHLNVQFLWVQDKIKDKSFSLHKVPGERNPADLMTKHLDAGTAGKHLDTLGFVFKEGRAAVAPELSGAVAAVMSSASEANVGTGLRTKLRLWRQSGTVIATDASTRQEGAAADAKAQKPPDEWSMAQYTCSRVHLRPRTDLFIPLRVENSPPARSLFSVRVTEGRFCKSGETFTRVDSWTDRKAAHLPLRAEWTGTTTFMLKPQLISSVAECSRSEKGSASCDVVFSGCPSIARVDRHGVNLQAARSVETVPSACRDCHPLHNSLHIHNHRGDRDSQPSVETVRWWNR